MILYRLKVNSHSVLWRHKNGLYWEVLIYRTCILGVWTLGLDCPCPRRLDWLAAFWTFLIVLLVDLLLLLVKLLIHVLALPLSFLSAGMVAWAIEGVFKYVGLLVASSWTAMFTIPWILGAFWWQALLIGFAFAVIGAITTSSTSSSD